MHYNGAVVTIREASSHTQLREYFHSRVDNTSEVTLFLPFGSEYEFFFKFTDGIRRRLELTIDGTVVTKDIILAGPQAVLERFIDTQKRFKFVSLDNPGVQDPTSSANGGIEVRLYKEKQRTITRPPYIIRSAQFGEPTIAPLTFKPHGSASPSSITTCSVSAANPGNITSSANVHDGTACCNNSIPCSAPVFDSYVPKTREISEGGYYEDFAHQKGATVEGSMSSQSFTTTQWNGDDGLPQIFKFNLRGKDKQQVAIKCPYCETYNKSEVATCIGCGALFQK